MLADDTEKRAKLKDDKRKAASVLSVISALSEGEVVV
jgi:hypothetical protein